MPLGQNLRENRKRRGFSQDQLAKMAGVALSTLTKIEAGTATQPTIDTVIKLADAFGISIDELVGRKLPNPKKKSKA